MSVFLATRHGLFAALAIAIAFAVATASCQSTEQAQLPSSFELPKPIRPSDILEVANRSVREDAETARVIVLAQCIDRKVELGEAGHIYTYYTFESKETIKGPAKPRFTLRLLGGTVGNETIPLPLDREFTIGDEYVLMLGPDNAAGYPTINPAAVFSVKTEPESRRKVVVPAPDGLPLFEKATGKRLSGSRHWAFLDDFIFSLKKVL
jgi:hypothetical protein